jgi:hypothetical protein
MRNNILKIIVNIGIICANDAILKLKISLKSPIFFLWGMSALNNMILSYSAFPWNFAARRGLPAVAWRHAIIVH